MTCLVKESPRRGSRGWALGPPLGRRGTIRDTPFNNIQAPVHHWAPTQGEILYPPLSPYPAGQSWRGAERDPSCGVRCRTRPLMWRPVQNATSACVVRQLRDGTVECRRLGSQQTHPSSSGRGAPAARNASRPRPRPRCHRHSPDHLHFRRAETQDLATGRAAGFWGRESCGIRN